MSMKTKLKVGLILLVMIGLFGASGVSLMTFVGGARDSGWCGEFCTV